MDIDFLRKIHRRLRMFQLVSFGKAITKVLNIMAVKPYTMIDYPRLAVTYDLVYEGEKYNEIEGAIVECGTWNGGYAALMNRASELCGKKRHVWLFDSFEGLPAPTHEDITYFGKRGKKGTDKAEEALVEKAFGGVEEKRVHIVPGWFQETFSKALPEIGKIAYLHLDADYYESTKYCLEKLYPMLSPGALVLIDDYAYWLGCQQAVDEFLAEHNISSTLIKTVQLSAYFRKI